MRSKGGTVSRMNDSRPHAPVAQVEQSGLLLRGGPQVRVLPGAPLSKTGCSVLIAPGTPHPDVPVRAVGMRRLA